MFDQMRLNENDMKPILKESWYDNEITVTKGISAYKLVKLQAPELVSN